jgi:hypothetical protein
MGFSNRDADRNLAEIIHQGQLPAQGADFIAVAAQGKGDRGKGEEAAGNEEGGKDDGSDHSGSPFTPACHGALTMIDAAG